MDDRTLRVLEYDKIMTMLAQETVSCIGREHALQLRPFKDKATISRLLDETSEAETVITSSGSSPITEFPDIRPALRRAEIGAVLSIVELLEIGQVLKVCKRAKQEVEGKKQLEHLTNILRLLSRIKQHDALGKEISRCIESEERISDNASQDLANIRRHMHRTNEKVRDRLNSIISSPQLQKYLQEPIITIRNGRYVVPVKQEHKSSIQGLIHDQSSSGATFFIEPMSVVEANNELREWKMKEDKEIERILAELSDKVAEAGQGLFDSVETLSWLDLIFAKAKLSISMTGVRPKLVDEQRFNIVNGRHPLIKHDEVVPINMRLGNDFNILIITGPNTGGKTVTLKTAGLFVLLNQSGLHIPAGSDTEMGIFEAVYADIGDEQSIEQSLSTFSSHMSNIVPMISRANSKSLLLFDELGAGTDPVEGAALAMAVLDFLNEQKTSVMATTHYSELKAFALIRNGMENASTEFDVETLRPTYRLFIGIPGKSNAFEISRRLGLQEHLIERAKEFVSQENMRFEEIIGNIEQNRLKAQQDRDQAQKQLEVAESLKMRVEAAEDQLDRKREEIIRKAREEARDILFQAKDQSDILLKEMQQLSLERDLKERNSIIEKTRKKFREKLSQADRGLHDRPAGSKESLKAAENLKPGEMVYITNINQKGQVLGMIDQNQELLIQVGIMKVNIHKSNLRRIDGKESKETIPSSRIALNTRMIATEISVRGQTLEEALANVDKYLDEAFLSGLNEVTVIHGKGMGILRNGIHELLRNHPNVKSFRLGRYGEGEWGVTIVTLK